MGILDGIVEWVSEQVMNALDLITTSVLGTLGCDMNTFLRFFPAAETMYGIFVATAVGLVLLNWIWQLFKNFGLIAGVEAEDSLKLSIRSVLFISCITPNAYFTAFFDCLSVTRLLRIFSQTLFHCFIIIYLL